MSKLQEAIEKVLAGQSQATGPSGQDLYNQVNNKGDDNVPTDPTSPTGDADAGPDAQPTDPAAQELAAVTTDPQPEPESSDAPSESDKSEGSGDGDNASDEPLDFGDNDDEGSDLSFDPEASPDASDGQPAEGNDDTGCADQEDATDSEANPEGTEELGGDEPPAPESGEAPESTGEPEGAGSETGGEETDPEDSSQTPGEDSPQGNEGSGEAPSETGGEETGDQAGGEASEQDPEVGGDDPSFNEDGSLSSLDDVEDAAKGKDDVSHAASVVNEAKELSDRLGDLARELVEREDLTDASTESIRRMIKISVESIQDRAELLVGEAVNVIDGHDPYLAAITKAVTKARDTLRQIRDMSQGMVNHALSERAQSLKTLVTGLEAGVKDLTIPTKAANYLAIDGSLDLDAYAYAGPISTLMREVTEWLRGSIGPYLIEAGQGKRPSFAPLSSSLVKPNEALTVRLQAENVNTLSNEASNLLPGNSVFTYVASEGYPALMTCVTVKPTSSLPTMVTVQAIEKSTLDRLMSEMSVYGATVVKAMAIVNQLFEVLSNVESWATQTWDEDREAVAALRVEHLVTAVTLPVVDVFYYAYKQYLAINELFEAVEAQQAETGNAE